jgi:hypothetical protein
MHLTARLEALLEWSEREERVHRAEVGLLQGIASEGCWDQEGNEQEEGREDAEEDEHVQFTFGSYQLREQRKNLVCILRQLTV